MISLLGLLQLPLWMTVAVFKQPNDDLKSKFFNAFKPNSKWGPVDLKISESKNYQNIFLILIFAQFIFIEERYEKFVNRRNY